MKVQIFSVALVLAVSVNFAWAADVDPTCLGSGQDLTLNNEQVIQWKKFTANQFLARAHVSGVVAQIFPDKNGHKHFEIQLDGATGEAIEIVYNVSFGALPTIQKGMTVEACGDYITSNQATSQYPASPDGAILHWIHKSPNPTHHASGYLEIDSVVYGGQ